MTPSAEVARRRALLQLANGALPEAPEVDVSEVSSDLPLEDGDDASVDPAQLGPAPARAMMAAGVPQEGTASDLYGEALDQQRARQQWAGLHRGVNRIIQGLTDVAPDEGAQRTLDEGAKEPVVEYFQRQKLAEEQQRADLAAATMRAKTAAAEWGSPASIAARRNLKVNFPSLTDADLEGVTAANAHDFGVIRGQSMQQLQHAGDKVSDLEQRGLDRNLRQQELGLKAEALNQARNQFASTLGFKYEELDAENQRAVDRLLETKAGREQQETHHIEDQTKEFSTKYDASGLPEFDSSYKAAMQVVARHPKSLPGTGPLQGRVSGLLVGDDAKTLRSAIGKIKQAYQKSVTGTGAGEKEQADIARATMLMDSSDDRSIILGLKMMENIMSTKADAIRAGYKPEAIDAYLSRLQAQPFWLSPLATQPSSPKVARPPAAPASLPAPQPSAASKKYSKSKDTTYLFDAQGTLIGTEPGDTRGR